MKKKILFSAALTILLCMCIIAGSTFAMFTSDTGVSMIIGSATVQVSASITGFDGTSRGQACVKENGVVTFANGGTASMSGNQLTLVNMTPGDKVTVTINVANGSNIITKCTASTSVSGDLAGALKVTYDSSLSLNGEPMNLAPGVGGSVIVTVELPESTGNEYQNKSATVTLNIHAVQGNG